MDWSHVLGIILGNAAFIIPLFLWNRAESRADVRNTDSKLELYRQQTNAMIRAIHDEIKDFHGRLERQDAEFKSHLIFCHDKTKQNNG